MRYTYDSVIEHDDDGWAVGFPRLPEAVTFGATRAEAVSRAAEVRGSVSPSGWTMAGTCRPRGRVRRSWP